MHFGCFSAGYSDNGISAFSEKPGSRQQLGILASCTQKRYSNRAAVFFQQRHRNLRQSGNGGDAGMPHRVEAGCPGFVYWSAFYGGDAGGGRENDQGAGRNNIFDLADELFSDGYFLFHIIPRDGGNFFQPAAYLFAEAVEVFGNPCAMCLV